MHRNRLLWLIQIALALMFLMAGAAKLSASDATLATRYPPPPLFMRGIGILELLGAIGLVLPGLLRRRPALTPLAAAGLTAIMAGAVITTLMQGPPGAILLPLGLGLLAAGVAAGRWRPLPLAPPSRPEEPMAEPRTSSVSN